MTLDADQIRDLTDSLAPELIVPPLGYAADVCQACRDWTDGATLCPKCRNAQDLLGMSPAPVVPISLYIKPSAMRDRLTFYKDPRSPANGQFAIEVAAIFERFFAEHTGEVAARFGDWDVATVIPSKHAHDGPHPLHTALIELPARSVLPLESLLRPGGETIDRRQPAPGGFVADTSVAGRSVILLDDVYTTGATAQSAVYALVAAGARVPAVVVAGRRLNPTAFQPVAALVERQMASPFSFAARLWGA